MMAASIWSGSRRVLSADAPNPAASTPGGAAVDGDAGMSQAAQAQYKILVVGDSGVGKTCLLLRYTQGLYAEQVSTVGVDFCCRDVTLEGGLRVKLQLWDTAGQERYRAAMTSYYRGSHGVLFVFGVDDRASFDSIPRWIEDVRRVAGDGAGKLLVAAKADTPSSEHCATKAEIETLAQRCGVAWVETSAREDYNVDSARPAPCQRRARCVC